jgi:hypothetical protein
LIHPVQEVFKFIDVALPERGHLVCPVAQWGKCRWVRTIEGLAAMDASANQSSALQNAQMFRDRWLRYPSVAGQRPNTLFAASTQTLKQCSPSWVGKCFEKHGVV